MKGARGWNWVGGREGGREGRRKGGRGKRSKRNARRGLKRMMQGDRESERGEGRSGARTIRRYVTEQGRRGGEGAASIIFLFSHRLTFFLVTPPRVTVAGGSPAAKGVGGAAVALCSVRKGGEKCNGIRMAIIIPHRVSIHVIPHPSLPPSLQPLCPPTYLEPLPLVVAPPPPPPACFFLPDAAPLAAGSTIAPKNARSLPVLLMWVAGGGEVKVGGG